MITEIWQVDAFTERPFTGNPAAVCILTKPRDAAWYQSVAAEMNLSETAFLHAQGGGYDLRWFTPLTEVELCGHATLASAHILWETGRLARTAEARFETKSGLLSAALGADDGWIVLDFPSTPPEKREPPDGLDDILTVSPRWVGASRFDLLVELANADTVVNLEPDMTAIAELPFRGIIVTARAGDSHDDSPDSPDFVSRFFGPRAGVPEDPVTGSAHCALAPFWGTRLGRTSMVGRQVSRRGGTVRVDLVGDRVRLGGQAVTVLRAELLQG